MVKTTVHVTSDFVIEGIRIGGEIITLIDFREQFILVNSNMRKKYKDKSFHIKINSGLLEKLDKEVKRLGITRTAFITLLIVMELNKSKDKDSGKKPGYLIF